MMMMSTTTTSTTTGLLRGRRGEGGEGGGGGVRKGAWSQEEDLLLRKCIEKYGEGKWRQVPLKAGLNRCRKSCRLRWLNYLRPNIKRGEFTSDEVDLIIRMHKLLGNRWSLIAGRLPGRTANDIKNYSNTHLKKMLLSRVHHHHYKKDHDKLLKAAADHDHGHGNKNTTLKPKAIKVLKPLPRTFSSRKKLFHKQQQQRHFEGGRGGSIDHIISSNNSNRVNTNSTSPVAAIHSDADDEKREEETSDLLLTSFGEELLNSFCGDDGEDGMELMNNINMEHWDDCDLHLDDNLWRLLEIEREIIM